jgi:recombinational DNA repair protein (RecF pathway)
LLDVDTRDYLTANLRELTRIAFSLRSGALLRLIAYAGIAPSLEKCYRKNPRAGFSAVSLFFN